MFGPDGALAGVHGGSIVIDMSKVSPDVSHRLLRGGRRRKMFL